MPTHAGSFDWQVSPLLYSADLSLNCSFYDTRRIADTLFFGPASNAPSTPFWHLFGVTLQRQVSPPVGKGSISFQVYNTFLAMPYFLSDPLATVLVSLAFSGELMQSIIMRLSATEVASCSLVCSTWARRLIEDCVWK